MAVVLYLYIVSVFIIRIDQVIKNCSGGKAIIVNMNCFRFNFSCLQLDDSALRRCAKHLNEYNYVCVINIYVTPDCIQSSLSVFVDEFTEFAVPTFSS